MQVFFITFKLKRTAANLLVFQNHVTLNLFGRNHLTSLLTCLIEQLPAENSTVLTNLWLKFKTTDFELF